jgi:tetratricopeptide (TPR) repeat protein
MHDALVRLAKVAKESDSLDDERFALSQLVMIAPHQLEYGDRLREINEQHGFDDTNSDVNLFDEQFMKAAKETAEPELETFADVTADASLDEIAEDVASADFAIVGTPIEAEISAAPAETNADDPRQRLLREVDSIRFYIDSGYLELAAKAIGELREEFGDSSEIADLVQHLKSMESAPEQDLEIVDPVTPAAPATNGTLAETTTDGTIAEPPKGFGIDELRNELGIDEGDPVDDSDYETHYHTAVAYQEMGLLDEAIREFQEAVGLVQPNDPARRFFQCANLLGHCFMQKSMPSLALTWFQRALETPGLGDEEKQGIWYEIASAYEADGDIENAGRYFEQVYTENINFRDVSERVRNMALSQ